MDILKKEICFLSKDKIYCAKDKSKFDKELILSPYYYWYFEKKLPTSNIKRAKLIVSQMLESSLPKDKNFHYILRKKDNKTYDIFVLDYDLLIIKLNTLGIKKELVSSLSFSHLEFEECSISLENSILLSFEGSVAEIENQETISSNLLKIDMITLLKSKQKLSFKHNFSKGNIVQKSIELLDKNFIAIMSILVLVFSSLLIELFTTMTLLKKIEEKKDNLIKSQNYATHSVQLKYVMNEILEFDFKQKSLKNNMNNILKIKGTGSSYISQVEYDNGEWFIDVFAENKKNADILLKDKKFNFIREDKNNFKYEKLK